MSLTHEDRLMEVYLEVERLKIKDKFDKQLNKMSTQEKHRWKSTPEKWEYALDRVKGWNPNK